ncbi:hypothetical protein LEN26_014025 [Aphanomyces euteiches]|nr:hypothetical protein Ae201684P_010836 [Aphanomyces euteiches]KAH9109432.1 hypothetical protein LEN26_014025 [Aphanomyces euteiches]KAH9123201.1 hypothetical protein AeMF1_005760 [Aphanomyces euteiches]
MLEILATNGNNTYKIPHLSKDKQLREGTLPRNLECDAILYRHTKSKLSGTIDLESMLDGVVQEARLEDELSSQLQSIAMEFDVGAIENALNELHIVPITFEEDESTDGIADGLRPLESLPSENETEEIWKI